MSSAKKIVDWYKAAALMVFNTLVFFILVNLAIALFFGVQKLFTGRDRSDPLTQVHGSWSLKSVYPDLSEAEVRELWEETRTRPVGYTPFAQFKEAAYHGHYVNVDAGGFRLVKNQGPWPPQAKNLNIFVFGGSTAFGFGVKDEQTISSYLQEKLSAMLKRPVCVYNFGCAFYYSSQERIRFQNLLMQGTVPNLAVFLDGPNDFYYADDKPEFSEEFGQLLSGEYLRKHQNDFLSRLPVLKAVRVLSGADRRDLAADTEPVESEETMRTMAKDVLGRYWANLKLTEALASVYDVRTCFVWQPVPMYKFNLKNHPVPANGFGRQIRSAYGYEYLSAWLQSNAPPPNFLNLADFQENRDEPLYVDRAHYSARMSGMLADAIAQFVTDHRLAD
jgi:hypothetical protein